MNDTIISVKDVSFTYEEAEEPALTGVTLAFIRYGGTVRQWRNDVAFDNADLGIQITAVNQQRPAAHSYIQRSQRPVRQRIHAACAEECYIYHMYQDVLSQR